MKHCPEVEIRRQGIGHQSMWDGSPPPNDSRALPRLGLGLWLVLKGPDRAQSLRRSARRLPDGLERAAKVATADWLDWAAEHPDSAVPQVEAAWDWVVHRQDPDSPALRWA